MQQITAGIEKSYQFTGAGYRNSEVGLRPVGAYAPEGMRNVDYYVNQTFSKFHFRIPYGPEAAFPIPHSRAAVICTYPPTLQNTAPQRLCPACGSPRQI